MAESWWARKEKVSYHNHPSTLKKLNCVQIHNSILFEVYVIALQYTIFKLYFWWALNIFEVPLKPVYTFYFEIEKKGFRHYYYEIKQRLPLVRLIYQ